VSIWESHPWNLAIFINPLGLLAHRKSTGTARKNVSIKKISHQSIPAILVYRTHLYLFICCQKSWSNSEFDLRMVLKFKTRDNTDFWSFFVIILYPPVVSQFAMENGPLLICPSKMLICHSYVNHQRVKHDETMKPLATQ
jgi:hypothetical protein